MKRIFLGLVVLSAASASAYGRNIKVRPLFLSDYTTYTAWGIEAGGSMLTHACETAGFIPFGAYDGTSLELEADVVWYTYGGSVGLYFSQRGNRVIDVRISQYHINVVSRQPGHDGLYLGSATFETPSRLWQKGRLKMIVQANRLSHISYDGKEFPDLVEEVNERLGNTADLTGGFGSLCRTGFTRFENVVINGDHATFVK